MDKGAGELISSECGGCVGSMDNGDEMELADSGVQGKSLNAKKMNRPIVSRSFSDPIKQMGPGLVDYSCIDIVGPYSMKLSNHKSAEARRIFRLSTSEAHLHAEEKVTDIEDFPSTMFEAALERGVLGDPPVAIAKCKWNSFGGSEQRFSRHKNINERLKSKNKRHPVFLPERRLHLFGQSTIGVDVTSAAPPPIIQDEICNESTQPKKCFVAENVLKQHIAVDISSGHPYIIPLPSLCDACDYCEDTCELEDCRDCSMKREKAKFHQPCSQTARMFSMCQVRRHNRTGTAWLVCSSRVYDCTL